MSTYYLFIDESESKVKKTNDEFAYNFTVAGIIIKDDDYQHYLKPAVASLKREVWYDFENPEDLILHEMDIRAAIKGRRSKRRIKDHYKVFRSRARASLLFYELNDLVNTTPMKVVGASINTNQMYSYYSHDRRDVYLIAMQTILENFCHFLQDKGDDAYGVVFVESRQEQDDAVRELYEQVKRDGSMFITAEGISSKLTDIYFPKKSENNPGLQIADFVPNVFARKALGIKPHRPGIHNELRKIRYNGGVHRSDLFGVKVIPTQKTT